MHGLGTYSQPRTDHPATGIRSQADGCAQQRSGFQFHWKWAGSSQITTYPVSVSCVSPCCAGCHEESLRSSVSSMLSAKKDRGFGAAQDRSESFLLRRSEEHTSELHSRP